MVRPLLLTFVVPLLLLGACFALSGLSPLEAALGHPGADTGNHLWGYGEVARALAELRLPWEVQEKAWPEGGSLWFIDLPMATLLAPVTWVFGATAAYNLGILLNFWFAGFAAWRLCIRAGAPAAGALGAGIVFQLQPHLWGQAYNGISETLAVGPMAVVLAELVLLQREPNHRTALWLGVFLGLCTWMNPYYGLLAAGMAVGLGLWSLWGLRGRRLRQIGALWGIAALVAALVVLPFALLFRQSLEADNAMVGRDPEFVYASLVGHNMVDILAFFHPGRWYSPDLKALFDDDMVVVVYLGAGLLGLAAFGIREGKGWVVGAVTAWVLALGPFLYLNGRYVRLGENSFLPLPFLAIYDLVPALARISHPYRFVILCTLCLVVLAARALRRVPRGRRGAVAAVAAVLVSTEFLVASPAPYPLPTMDTRADEVSMALSMRAEEGAVLDLPASLAMLDRSRYDLAQLHHGRPIPYGLNDPTPALFLKNPLLLRILNLERSPVRSLDPTLPLLELELGRRLLAAQGLAFIVVHTELYPAGKARAVMELLDLLCGPPQLFPGAALYQVR